MPFLHFCLDRQDFFVYMASQGVCEENARNAMGDTLLMACAGRLRAGLWLIGRPSADPLARNRAGENFLHAAAWHEFGPELSELAGRVVAAGADPLEPGPGLGVPSPAEFAMSRGNDPYAAFLLSKSSFDAVCARWGDLNGLAAKHGCRWSLSVLEAVAQARDEKLALGQACARKVPAKRGPRGL